MLRSKMWGVVMAAVGAIGIGPVACGNSANVSDADEVESVHESRNELIQVPTNGGVTTLAGTGLRGADDAALAANGTFNDPAGVAVASDGTIYVADWGNNSVRRIKPDGSLDTFLKGNPNLIRNARAEEPPTATPGIPQWSLGAGGTWTPTNRAGCSSCGFAFDGSRIFWPGGGSVSEAFQVESGSVLTPYMTALNAGRQDFRLSCTYRAPTAAANVEVRATGPGGILQSTVVALPVSTAWRSCDDISIKPPAGTDTIRFSLQPTVSSTYFDAIQLRPLPQLGSTDPSIVGPTALAIGPNGNVYVGASGITTSQGGAPRSEFLALRIFTPSGQEVSAGFPVDYNRPTKVSSVSFAPDGSLWVVDPTSTLLRVRGAAGNWYYADVQATANGEPLSVAVSMANGQHRLASVYRGFYKIYTYDCPPSSGIGVTVACQLAAGVATVGSTNGYLDDLDGTAGGERFSYFNSIAYGRNGDLLAAEEANNVVRRIFAPLTQTAAGNGTLGFADGASSQAKFFSPSSVAAAPDGSLIVADRMNNRIRKIACAGINVCGTPVGQCSTIPTDDQNSCTPDTCLVLGVRHDVLANGSTCTDSNACTTQDTCNAGTCVGGPPISVNDNDACTTDTCDTATGNGIHTPNYTDNDTTDCRVPSCNKTTGAITYVTAPEGTTCGVPGSGRRCDPNQVCETAAPQFSAPTLDGQASADFGKITEGIWSGASAIQKKPDGTSVSASKFEPGHAGWLIGQVNTRDGLPLANVTVSIANDAGFGQTKTRVVTFPDGHSESRFDLIVNGGRSYTVRFEKPGHLPVDREVYVGWEETQAVPTVIMLTADGNPTTVDLGVNGNGSQQFAVAAGSATTDDDGTRTAKLMLPVGITATINGTKLASMNLRLTEYTVGADGPARMPASLPPTTGYTYAVEISADESLNANGAKVTFNKPAYAYVENFVSAPGSPTTHPPVKTVIPSGYYDRNLRRWVPSTSGLVIKVLKGQSLAAGSQAEVDVTGDDAKDIVTSAAMVSLNFTAEELVALRSYPDGTTLWRVPIDHLTPWDFNFAPRQDCDSSCQQPAASATAPKPLTCESSVPGSIIGCESQSLGETLPVAGTPFTLNYNTSRFPLYSNWRRLAVPIRALPAPPANATYSANVRLTVAGKQIFGASFGPGPAKVVLIDWDGLDAFNRPVVGSVAGVLESDWYASYDYLEEVQTFNQYGIRGTSDWVRRNRKVSEHNRKVLQMPGFSAPEGSWFFGGWTLSAHHYYDRGSGTLFLGTGATRQVDSGLYTIKRIAGSGKNQPNKFAADGTSLLATDAGIGHTMSMNYDLAVASNGDVYFIDIERALIRKIDANSIVNTVVGKTDNQGNAAGVYSCANNGENLDSATGSWLQRPNAIAFGPNGTLFIADDGDGAHVIRRLTPNGGRFTIDTVAGLCGSTSTQLQDGVAAKGTALPNIIDLAVSPDGYVYLATNDYKIHRFSVGGKMESVAGNGTNVGMGNDPTSDGKYATEVSVGTVTAIDVGQDGSLYVTGDNYLFKVRPDGTLRGLSAKYPKAPAQPHNKVENVPFVDNDYVQGATRLVVAPDGQVYFNDTRTGSAIRRLDSAGVIQTIAQSPGIQVPPSDGASALANGIIVYGLAVAPDGSVVAIGNDNSIYRIFTGGGLRADFCNDSAAFNFIPDGDQAYCFDKYGRHLSTINWRTGKTLLAFKYNATGLYEVIDAQQQPTTLSLTQSDPDHPFWTIISPYGQTTKIDLNDRRVATKISDALGATQLQLIADGQLGGLTDRNSNDFKFTYAGGLLIEDKSPLSDTPQKLDRTEIAGGFRVTHTTPLGRITTHDVTRDSGGLAKQVKMFPDKTQSSRTELWDGGSTLNLPDGTTISIGRPSADPIVGLRDPVPGTQTVTLPTGSLTLSTSQTRCGASKVTNPDNTTTFTQFSGAIRSTTALACNGGSDPFSGQPAHETLKRVWDTTGQTFTSTSRGGRSTTRTTDAAGRTTQFQIGNLTPTVYVYDPATPAQLKYIKRGSRTEELTYRGKFESGGPTADADAGFVKKITHASTDTVDFTRDIFGRPLSVVEAKTVSGIEGTTTLGWDGNGNLKLVTPPTNHQHDLLYDAINGLKQYKPPVLSDVPSPQTDYVPTADRTPSTETRPDGVVVTHNLVESPNKTDQIDTITFPNNTTPTGKIDFDYYQVTDTSYSTGQAPGKVKSIKGPYGSTILSFEYNGALTTKVSWQNVTAPEATSSSVAWGFDSNLLRNSETVTPMTGSSVTRHLSYDQDDLLKCNSYSSADDCSSLACSGGDCKFKWTRSTSYGALTDITWGSTATAANQLAEHWEYSDTAEDKTNETAFGELRSQTLSYGNAPSTPLAEIVYDSDNAPRDALGRIYVKTETLPGIAGGIDTTYDYDDRGRLEGVTKTGSLPEAFGYDTNGNRTSCTSNGKSYVGVYDEQDRLSTYGSSNAWSATGDIRYTYGKNGELKKREFKNGQTWTYNYDPLGNLIAVVQTGPSGTSGYQYYVDGLGRRIARKRVSSPIAVTNRWLYRDGLTPVAELDGTGKLTSLFVYGSRPNVPDFVIKFNVVTGAKTIYRLFSDHLGSPRLAVNINDRTEMPYRVDYSAFGVPEAKPTSTGAMTDLAWIPFGFAGGLYDKDTGLERFGARDYDPTIGRWVSKDPSLFRGGINLYAYAKNDPVNYFDANGRNPVAIAVAILAGLAIAGDSYHPGSGEPGLLAAAAFGCFGAGALSPVIAAPAAAPEIAVIGPLEAYGQYAAQIGGRIFATEATGEALLLENQAWLDGIIASGEPVALAAGLETATAGSMFEAELNYLIANGYVVNEAGTMLFLP